MQPHFLLVRHRQQQANQFIIGYYTVKKGSRFSRPQPGCHLPNSPRTGIIKLIQARKGLVSDIPAGDGKTANFFYSVYSISDYLQYV
jgi:hypothetical protein